ncbi:MAG TPA: tetratricopeptide repeat protein [Pyrinomonadaceae bacterium]|nr:tetratricopeptide repeat protein [Pyrinomonadaceae bacterium]
MPDWMRPLLLMFYSPSRAMAEARDRAPLGAAFALALAAQIAYTVAMLWSPFVEQEIPSGPVVAFAAFITSASLLFPVAVVFVPLLIFFANLFERRGSFGLVLQQEFAPAASAVFYAWAAANLLALALTLVARAAGLEAEAARVYAEMRELRQTLEATSGEVRPEDVRALWRGVGYSLLALATSPLTPFVVLAVAAVRQVFGFARARSVLVALLAGLVSAPLAAALLMIFGPLLSSPFIILLLFFILRGYAGEMMRGQRARAAFRQNLEAATLNPADASAHYNLGLIHLQRRELEEARARFERAVEVDPEDVDSHYQLGRIAREQGRLPEAVGHFGEVVSRDEAHAQHEVWREVGATYLAAGQFADARDALERFLDRRSSDPEALYLMGRAQFGLGDVAEARAWMERCVEAVRTAPAYKYRSDKRWLDEAQQFLRTQA